MQMAAGTFRMRVAARVGAMLIAFAALSSCATLNEDQCASVDWRELGQQNGAQGKPMDFVQRHEQACSRYKLPVNQSAWREGWEEGIRRYCTPQNGLSEGRAGHAYAGSCPGDTALGFEDAYRVGKAAYDAQRERENLENEIDSLRARRDDEKDRKEQRELSRRLREDSHRLREAERRERFANRRYEDYIYAHDLAQN